jgi:hypothetical protein
MFGAALLFAITVCAAPPPALFLNAIPIQSPLAVCNDGSPTPIYYRNCSANWDTKGPDYCANITNRWVIVFAGDDVRGALRGEPDGPAPAFPAGAFCYDGGSCASRAPALRTSAGLPKSGFPGGFLSPYAEVNPNFYKSSSVVIPYCSSDLFLGNTTANGTHFRGAEILNSALTALLALPNRSSLAFADEVFVVGGAGVISQLPRIRARLLAAKRAAVGGGGGGGGGGAPPLLLRGVCDGCALLPDLPGAPSPPRCERDNDCPPSEALPRGMALWGAGGGPPWRSLAAPALLAATAAAGLPLLAFAQEFDAVALSAYGAWGGGANGSGAAWARRTYAPALRAALRGSLPAPPRGAAFVGACAAWPPALALAGGAWYGELAACKDGAGRAHNNTPAQVAAAFSGCLEGAPQEFCLSCGGGGGGSGGCALDAWAL